MHIFLHALKHAALHTLQLLPFLYLTYLLMEMIERYAGERTQALIARSGKAGPLFGALLGALPQCGFSAAGAGLYAGGIVTKGTLLALFWSTSDEMLPVLITGGVELTTILKLLAVKVALAALAGFAVDLVARRLRRPSTEERGIEELCRAQGCHCESQRLWVAALIHTAQIVAVIFAVTLGLELLFEYLGEDALASLLQGRTLVMCLVAGLVGLIPNCAASVAITQLYLSGVLSAGAMLSGLMTGAGVGLLVLFRTNRPMKDNFVIVGILLGVSVVLGLLMDALGLSAFLA